MRLFFPHPLMSVALVIVWLLLANDLSLGHILLGAVLGTVIPLFTNAFWPERPRLARPLRILALAGRLIGDIIVANFAVARAVLWPRRALRPGFVHFPLELTNEFAITVLASLVSLTPGTVSADLSTDRRILLIHALDLGDGEDLIREIKARYEQPLREIFPC